VASSTRSPHRIAKRFSSAFSLKKVYEGWTLTNTLATFQVLGQDYANLVVIQMTSSTTGTTAVVDGTLWFAKGIGMIRSEQSGTSLGVAGRLIEELVSTNLIP
jgi:hypothetical protein